MKYINFALATITLISSKFVLADEAKKISTNVQCGAEHGSCPEGNCCSQWGWCGTGSAFCGAGCLPEFGICDEAESVIDDKDKISIDGQCGEGHGRCQEGQCCSSAGWCGLSIDYCGTGCQSEFGECGQSAIDNATVEGFSYYSSCVQDHYWALTFDDGPYIYDHKLLDLLKEKNVKATFFVTGASSMDIKSDEAKEIIQRMNKEGHIIASHTWSHVDLTTITDTEIENEMTKLEDVVFQYIGKKPAFVRPPYGSGNGKISLAKKLSSLGYSVAVTWNIDTMDWSNKGDIEYAISQFQDNLGNSALSLNHVNYNGISEESLLKLIEAEIDFMLSEGYTPVTVERCLGIPAYQ